MKEQYREALQRPNRPTIAGARLIDHTVHVDSRGWLCEVMRRDDPHFGGFGQLSIVTNFAPRVIRAYHMHQYQGEVFVVMDGAIQFIIVDERAGSVTHQHLNGFVLMGERPQSLHVPCDVQHGLMALTQSARLLTVTTLPYDTGDPDEVRIPPDSYGDVWRVGW